MNNVTAFFDGSCEPVNPGGTAKWGFAVNVDGEFFFGDSGTIGHGEGMTNNLAEYRGAIACLEYLNGHHSDATIEMFGDSKLVVNMINGTWGKKKPHKDAQHLLPLLLRGRELFAAFDSISLAWVPREQNSLADWYSKRG